MRLAIEGLKEMIETLVALTPLEAAVAEAIEDLQRREAMLAEWPSGAERESQLVKRAVAVETALKPPWPIWR